MEEIEAQLRAHLKNGDDWEKLELFSNDKAYQIIRQIEQINPSQKEVKLVKKLEM